MKKIIYLFIFTVLLGSSCKKFLEHQPDDRTEVNTPVKVAELLTSAYPHGNYITFCEAMSDNANDKGILTQSDENSFPWKYVDQNGNTEDTPTYYWNSCYAAIAAANEALKAIDVAGNTSVYSASRGEALVARAYAHFMLVTLFSKTYDPATADTDPGIPYVLKPEEVVQGNYERKSVAYVYQQVEKDLLEGLPLLKDNTYRVPAYHFTANAAHAFATRFYLFKRDYQKVIDHANLVFPTASIANNLRPWNTIYNILGYYELQDIYTNSTQPANLLLSEAQSVWGRSLAGYRYGFGPALLTQIYASANNPVKVQLAMASQIYGGNETVYNIPKFKENFIKETISANFGNPYNSIPLFTTEEVLFNRAEANANLGNNAATGLDLDAYLSKRVVNYNATTHKFTDAKAQALYTTLTLKDALIASVINYKRQEFLFEGMRWFDILRLKLPVTHSSIYNKINITLNADDPRRVIQIPRDAVASGIPSNPR